jgi:hypothetical protein
MRFRFDVDRQKNTNPRWSENRYNPPGFTSGIRDFDAPVKHAITKSLPRAG